MLDEIHIEGFKSYKRATLPLDPNSLRLTRGLEALRIRPARESTDAILESVMELVP